MGKGLLYRVSGAAGGLFFCVPNILPAAAPLQLFSLIPVLYLIGCYRSRSREVALAGFYMGIAYTLPQLVLLRFPFTLALALLVTFMVSFLCFVLLCRWLFLEPSVLRSFLVGSLLVIFDWLVFTLVPFWGTAQSISRSWSRYPFIIQFISLVGITGITFIIASLQALAVCFVLKPKHRFHCAAAAVTVLSFVIMTDIYMWCREPSGSIKAAAIGWLSDDFEKYGDVSSEQGFSNHFIQPVKEAAKSGARIVVTPEMGFGFSGSQRMDWLGKFQESARSNKVFLAIGYFDGEQNQNRLVFIGPEGDVLGEYAKRHLTIFENYRGGDGTVAMIEVDGVRVGALICHDDNFTDITRRYGRQGIGILAVPTLDWLQVADAHFQNTVHRAIESRFAIIRASLDGISAVISGRGEIIAKCDHFKEGIGAIVADVPIYSQKTLFSAFGHWPVGVSAIFVLSYFAGNNVKRIIKKRGTRQKLVKEKDYVR